MRVRNVEIYIYLIIGSVSNEISKHIWIHNYILSSEHSGRSVKSCGLYTVIIPRDYDHQVNIQAWIHQYNHLHNSFKENKHPVRLKIAKHDARVVTPFVELSALVLLADAMAKVGSYPNSILLIRRGVTAVLNVTGKRSVLMQIKIL